jgi:hypothetical protein
VRTSVLRDIEDVKGLTHAFVLTHDIDFLFVQNLLLRALKSAGEPSLTVFADAERAATSFAAQGGLASGLGHRYRVVPVALASGGRFHPKAVLLAGPKGCTLHVGSGNLTFGGWCHNGEVWARFSTADGEGGAIAAFKAYLDELTALVPLADALKAEIQSAFDPGSRPWANPLPAPDSLVGRLGDGPSLLTRIGPRFRGPRLTVCSPFFDPEGAALLRVMASAGAESAEVLTQESSTNLQPQALASWPASVRTFPADYIHIHSKGDRTTARLHAKWMLASDGTRAVAVLGSANCSRAALTTEGRAGNAELVVVTEGPADELAEQLRAELEILERPLQPRPTAPDAEEDDQPAAGEPVILAARFDLGLLRVAVDPRGGFSAQEIEADGEAVVTDVATGGELLARLDAAPARVRVLGLRDGQPWATPELWVDVESTLRGSAGRRRLVDLVRGHQQSGILDVRVWGDVVEAVYEELATPSPWGGGGGAKRAERPDPAEGTWRADDVFLSSFTLARRTGPAAATSGEELVSAMLRLIFNWGQGERGIDEVAPSDADADREPIGIDPPDDADDEPEPPEPLARAPEAPPSDPRTLERANAALVRLVQLAADPAFLGERSPADIRRVIIMLALLLRTGRQHGWVTRPELFAMTQRAWRAVFFSSHAAENQGELASRLEREEDPEAFRSALATPRLAAALAAWGLAAHREGEGRDLVRFDLTCAVSAAHHPWMWRGAPLDRIREELDQLLRYTRVEGEDELLDPWWRQVQRRGAAIAALEVALRADSLKDLRTRLGPWEVRPGALLWQGSWCVTEAAASSTKPKDRVSVRKLQGDETERPFVAQYIVPLEPLLATLRTSLSEPVQAELRALLADVEAVYTQASNQAQ